MIWTILLLAVGYGTAENGEGYWYVLRISQLLWSWMLALHLAPQDCKRYLSWSTYWGNDGYVLISRNNSGASTDTTYPILKTIDMTGSSVFFRCQSETSKTIVTCSVQLVGLSNFNVNCNGYTYSVN